MNTQIVQIPSQLAMRPLMCFAAHLSDLPIADRYVFDGNGVQFATPFGMLVLGSVLRRFRAVRSDSDGQSRCQIRTPDPDSYLSYMGLWQSFGVPIGNGVGKAFRGAQHIPIRQLIVDDILRVHREHRWPISQAVEQHSIDIADVLVQEKDPTLEKTIDYAVRELLRNVIEHSESPRLWYCAQYWPSKDEVELGVLDEGVGIRASLSRNPQFAGVKESDAIRAAVQRGVSRTSVDRDSAASENSGDGLYVLRELARNAGSLFVLSNDDGIQFERTGTDEFSTSFKGTAVRLFIRPSQLGDLLDHVLATTGDESRPSRLTASRLARLRTS